MNRTIQLCDCDQDYCPECEIRFLGEMKLLESGANKFKTTLPAMLNNAKG